MARSKKALLASAAPLLKEQKAERKPRPWRTLPQAPAAYFIDEFCAAHRLSPSMYWKLKAEGKAPTEMQVGRRRMISFEAAERWRREREATAAS